MPSTRERVTKDGRRYFEIRCRVSRDRPELTTRWYVPDGWSKRAIDRELAKAAADFETKCKAGDVISRAEQKEKDAERDRELAKIQTLRQYSERVFMPAKAVTCAEHTRDSFQSNLNLHIYPALGDMKLPDISSANITALLLALQSSGLSHASVIKVYAIMNLLFKMAFMDGSIDVNPMERVARPKPRKEEVQGAEVEAFTESELMHILDCLEHEPLKWQSLIKLLIDTGMRVGEVCGLQWCDFSFTENTVTVAHTLGYTVAAGIYLDTPKSGRIRTIDVDGDVMNLLKRWRQEQATRCISSYVFTQDDSSSPMHPQTPARYMQKFSRRYGVENMHPHKLRHSFASVAITNGADIASVSQKLGHADPSTTLRKYTHANQESMRRASDVFRLALKAKEA